MEDTECKVGDKAYCDLLFNIRQKMHIVQAQLEIMNLAIEKCSRISSDNRSDCEFLINTAHNEILRFQELNVELTSLFNDFRKYVISKNL